MHQRCASCKEMMMGYYADCYVLTSNRTKKFVDEFLNLFTPNRKGQADIYEIPEDGKETGEEFDSADKLIRYLEFKWKHTTYDLLGEFGQY
jgi:hypothetical protein